MSRKPRAGSNLFIATVTDEVGELLTRFPPMSSAHLSTSSHHRWMNGLNAKRRLCGVRKQPRQSIHPHDEVGRLGGDVGNVGEVDLTAGREQEAA